MQACFRQFGGSMLFIELAFYLGLYYSYKLGSPNFSRRAHYDIE